MVKNIIIGFLIIVVIILISTKINKDNNTDKLRKCLQDNNQLAIEMAKNIQAPSWQNAYMQAQKLTERNREACYKVYPVK